MTGSRAHVHWDNTGASGGIGDRFFECADLPQPWLGQICSRRQLNRFYPWDNFQANNIPLGFVAAQPLKAVAE